MSGDSGYSLLKWDSEFFGHRIARVENGGFPADSADQILRDARNEAIDCLYLFVDAGDSESIRVAEQAGFHLADVRVTREREAPDEAGTLPEDIDLCRSEDVPALRAIARKSHLDSRFYHDPSFSRQRCDDLYDVWIENACNGAASGVIVARSAGRAVGYVTCEITSPGMGRLGLVAVGAGEEGKGHGRRMLKGSLSWLGAQGCERIRVVTQARNIKANRLYEAHGFRTVLVENCYHLWLGDEGTK